MRTTLLSLALLAGCSSATPDSDEAAEPVDSDAPAEEAAALYGTTPDEALAAPEFTATNADETMRTRENLLGKPHVLWFFPSAGTFG